MGEMRMTKMASSGMAAVGVKETCLAILMLLIGWTVACSQTMPSPEISDPGSQSPSVQSDSPSFHKGVELNASLMAAAERARQVVVRISSGQDSDRPKVLPEGHDFLNRLLEGPFLRKLFGEELGEWIQSQAKHAVWRPSSGVIVSQDGYILTTKQAVEPGIDLRIHRFDDRIFSGAVVGTDSETDLALVKIQAENLPVLKQGDFSQLKVGQIVLAVGSPPEINHLVTQGVISGLGPVAVDVPSVPSGTVIHTDAIIDSSNSGGALVNLSGELLGINSSTSGGLSGLRGMGVVIPIHVAGRVMAQLRNRGNGEHGWLGLSIQDLTQDLAMQFGMETAQGIVVTKVESDSPAAAAELRRGDIITQYDGEAVKDAETFQVHVRETSPGSRIPITVFRDGQYQAFTLTIGGRTIEATKKIPSEDAEASHPLRGVVVGPLTEPQRDRFSTQGGVLVKEVQSDTIAARAGLQPGDIIVEINEQPVHSVTLFQETVKSLPAQVPVLLLLERQNLTIFLLLQSVSVNP